MIILIALFTASAALSLAVAYLVYRSWRKRKLSFVFIINMVLALAGLMAAGYITFILALLVHTFVYIPRQGKIVDVLPDTSWIRDNRDVLYLKENRLYAIRLDGRENRQLYGGDVHYYALSPDKAKIAIYYANESETKDDRNTGNILSINLADGEVDPIERRADCGYPSWISHGSKIHYEYGDSYYIRIYDVALKTKKIVDEPKMVADAVSSKTGSRLFYSSLFDKKCYEVDVNTTARREVVPYQKTKGPTLSDCFKESDIYRGISGGQDVRDWRVESPGKNKTAYNKEGSLWLKTATSDEKLVSYIGIHDSKLAPGISPVSWSEDVRYLVSDFNGKIYVTDTESKKTGYLTDGDSARILGSLL